jgi:hypothetical protein
MKLLYSSAVALTLGFVCSCGEKNADLSYAGSVEVQVDGIDYWGTYMADERNGDIVDASGVVLWRKNAVVGGRSVSLRNGSTVIHENGTERVFPGRPLLLVDPPAYIIQVVSADIPIESYPSDKALNSAVEAMLTEWRKQERATSK